MIDFIWILICGFVGLMAGALIVEVFRWGYNKEQLTERQKYSRSRTQSFNRRNKK